MTTTSGRRPARSFVRNGALAIMITTGVWGASPARAGKLTCLTGTDPSVANDAYQIALTRGVIQFFGCPCSDFDGSPGKTSADYVKCVKQYVDGFVHDGQLRSQCKSTVLKESKATTCGWSQSQDKVTCVKKTAGGKVSCAIKPRSLCADKPGKFTQLACAPVTEACVDAADTNGDGRIGSGDSGACAAAVCGNGVREFLDQCDPPDAPCAAGNVCTQSCYCAAPTKTPTATLRPGQPTNTPAPPPSDTPTRTPIPGAPTSTPTRTLVPGAPTNTPTRTFTPVPRFVDNGDGTITDNQTGLMWEKKDQSGGLDDVNNYYLWAGDCSDGSGLCQPDGFAASLCASQTGGALGCLPCASPATCNAHGYTTIWHWLGQLRVAGLGGHSDWRLPTSAGWSGYPTGQAAELETILDTSAPGCGSPPYPPCVPAAFNMSCTPGCSVTGCSCTVPFYYWSASSVSAGPDGAWVVHFGTGYVHDFNGKTDFGYVRAVR